MCLVVRIAKYKINELKFKNMN
ncbi:protein of unknown function [Methanocaldococcus lauensis]|uniref:Uncharacterized protein n=1 Tax=Methanocaldococcus lauensis TaxID=2546128 RepID=A0A8D6SYU6_9EURY|nr:protein of unknown function [Methanocaldococcus lauensis]